MEDTKRWWTSKTMWVNVVAVIAAITGAFSMDMGLDPDTQIALVGGVMAVINMILRFITTTSVS